MIFHNQFHYANRHPGSNPTGRTKATQSILLDQNTQYVAQYVAMLSNELRMPQFKLPKSIGICTQQCLLRHICTRYLRQQNSESNFIMKACCSVESLQHLDKLHETPTQEQQMEVLRIIICDPSKLERVQLWVSEGNPGSTPCHFGAKALDTTRLAQLTTCHV
ncbi:TPA: hypothetical protein ACH3X1_000692 [Trebouxia sp. C0004]